MLSPMFNPQEFFLPEELLPPKKRGRDWILPPLLFPTFKYWMGESSVRIPPKRTSTSEASAMTQATIRKLVADSVATALEAQATTMASTNNPNRNTDLLDLL
ncbi:hypothetical protein Tco_0649141 [Tanacetum coccineum]